MLKIALPSGSLEKETLELFKSADLEVRRSDREYASSIDDPRIGKVSLLKAQEIPKFVEYGYFDLGITGMDWITERNADVAEIAQFNYSKRGEGKVKIVLAGSAGGKINAPKKIKDGSRVATEYINITKRYFEKLGKKVKIFHSYGTTEAKVPEMADFIVDLTETGETLRKNNLRIIDVILESSTKLIANRESVKDRKKRKEIEEIKTLLLGVIEARGKVLLTMNVEKSRLKLLVDALPAMKKPTVSRLYNTNYYAVETVVNKSDVNRLIPKLKEKGAEDILEMNITKIVK